jgi:hypothetical protein
MTPKILSAARLLTWARKLAYWTRPDTTRFSETYHTSSRQNLIDISYPYKNIYISTHEKHGHGHGH